MVWQWQWQWRRPRESPFLRHARALFAANRVVVTAALDDDDNDNKIYININILIFINMRARPLLLLRPIYDTHVDVMVFVRRRSVVVGPSER